LPASLPVRVNQSTNSSLLVEADAVEQARKVKLAGRRRLCKLDDTTTHQLSEEEGNDCESIRDIMDDLTTRLD
jgi:hypothetical protein